MFVIFVECMYEPVTRMLLGLTQVVAASKGTLRTQASLHVLSDGTISTYNINGAMAMSYL